MRTSSQSQHYIIPFLVKLIGKKKKKDLTCNWSEYLWISAWKFKNWYMKLKLLFVLMKVMLVIRSKFVSCRMQGNLMFRDAALDLRIVNVHKNKTINWIGSFLTELFLYFTNYQNLHVPFLSSCIHGVPIDNTNS